MRVIKRNGSEVDFDELKIKNAIEKANKECGNCLTESKINSICEDINEKIEEIGRSIGVEEIQDIVENTLMEYNAYNVARLYIRFRYHRELSRKTNTTDNAILSLIEQENEEIKQENSNKNPAIASTQRDYMAGEVSKDLTRRFLLPKDVVEAHDEGIIHFHDSDYFSQHIHNCDLVNLEDMLQNGTVISETMVEKPHTFSTACTIATQIMAQVASSQYGGQSESIAHLAPFVQCSRDKFYNQYIELKDSLGEEKYKEFVEKMVHDDIVKGVQTIQYQVITLQTTNGQAPFVTLFMYLDEVEEGQTRDDMALIVEEILKQRYQGVKNEKGVWVTPAFPKLIYVLDEDNITPDSKYYYLTELAAKCTAKRLVPDYISAKVMRELKQGNVYTCMGCRSFLTVYHDPKTGKPKFYGRFNQGVVTINLIDVALSAEQNVEKFWDILNERLELCHRALQCRHKRLEGTKSDIAPILWQNGALTRLKKGEVIDEYLHGGYSTISLGYAGLWECVYALNKHKLTEPEGEKLGLEIMQKLNDACTKWKTEENIDYSLYGTPIESTTYKFAKCLQRRFGIIEGVTDKNYITNSYHIKVTEEIDAFEKLRIESKFQALSPGGAISYIEVPNMQNNIEAVLSVMKFIYENITYAELNTKSDYCHICGYDGEIKIVEDEKGKLIWECPNCGNKDQDKMSVARRTCG